MSERRQKTIEVFESDEYRSDDWMPEPVQDAIAWLQEKLASIPEEWRDCSSVTIRGGGGWDRDMPVLTISYHRPETDAEMADRIQVQKQTAEAEEAELLRQLQQLRGRSIA